MTKNNLSNTFKIAAPLHSDYFVRGRNNKNERIPLQDLEAEIQLFLQHIPGKAMLDAGCGEGSCVPRFLEEELTYCGIDPSTNILMRAKKINPQARFQVGSFLKLPFASEQFDGIWSSCALTTSPKLQLQSILKEFDRVLKPGGIIMVVMPLLGYSDEELLKTKVKALTPLQISTYLPMELTSQIRVGGFTIMAEKDSPEKRSMFVLAEKQLD